MFLTGLGTAVPAQRFTQQDCWEAMQQAPQFSTLLPRSQILLRKIFSGDNGIASRHLSVETLGEAFTLTPDVLHARFATHAPALATHAAVRALAEAQLDADSLDAVVKIGRAHV